MLNFLKRLIMSIKAFFPINCKPKPVDIQVYLSNPNHSNDILGLEGIAKKIMLLDFYKLKEMEVDENLLIKSFPYPPPIIQPPPSYQEIQELPAVMWKSYRHAILNQPVVEYEDDNGRNRDIYDVWEEMIDCIDFYSQLSQSLSQHQLAIAVYMIYSACNWHVTNYIQTLANEIAHPLESTSFHS